MRVMDREGATAVSLWAHTNKSAQADEYLVMGYNMGDNTEQLCMIKTITGRSVDLVRTTIYDEDHAPFLDQVRFFPKRGCIC